MKKSIISSLGKFTVLFSMVATSLFSQDVSERGLMNEREVSEIQILVMQEEREVAETQIVAEQGEEVIEAAKEKVSFGSSAQWIDTRAYQYATDIGAGGSLIQIPDGSTWEVKWSDRWKVSHWEIDTPVYVMPGSNWSSYRYSIVNMNNGQEAQVMMSQYPFYDSPFTRYVVSVDPVYGRVLLNDGTYWGAGTFSSKYLNDWKQNDTVVIGVNNGISSVFNSYILINISLGKTYISANLLN